MSSSGTNSGAEEDLAEKIRGKRRARSPLQHRQTQTAGQQQHGDQQKQPLASSLKSSQSGQQQSQKGERMVGARFKASFLYYLSRGMITVNLIKTVIF